MTLLVDSNVLIDVLRGHEPARVWLQQQTRTPLAISVISVAEVFRGVEDSAQERAVRALFASFTAISIDAGIAEQAGNLSRRYGPSHGVEAADAIIVATALAERLPLATLNTKHFPMLKRVSRPY